MIDDTADGGDGHIRLAGYIVDTGGPGIPRHIVNSQNENASESAFRIHPKRIAVKGGNEQKGRSYSWDKHDVLRFGKGGVDDAEDAEVVLHEYGHAMLDSQSTPFGAFGASPEAGAIHEGFGDYWAVTVSDVIASTPDPACVADWDSVSYTSGTPHCLRRVDTDLHYPEDLNGRVHHDGQIWSRALWDIRNALGHVVADTIILEAQFGFAPDANMPDAAQATVQAALDLYNPAAANIVRAAFQARGILP